MAQSVVKKVNRRVRLALNSIHKLKKPPPNVNRVSVDEVWLLNDKNEQLYRICGYQNRRLPKGYVCMMRAGAGTNHKGYGRCRWHHGNPHQQRNTLLRWLQEKEIGTIVQSLEQAEQLSEEEISSVDGEVRVQSALVTETFRLVENKLRDPLEKISLADIRSLEISVEKLTELKERKARMRALDKVTAKDIKEYIAFIVGWFFGHARSFGEVEYYRRMLVDFDKEIRSRVGDEVLGKNAEVVDAEVVP